jgi:hypothetical protein
MPTPRHGLAAAVLNGKLWAVGGYSGGGFSPNEQYDPLADAWVSQGNSFNAGGGVNGREGLAAFLGERYGVCARRVLLRQHDLGIQPANLLPLRQAMSIRRAHMNATQSNVSTSNRETPGSDQRVEQRLRFVFIASALAFLFAAGAALAEAPAPVARVNAVPISRADLDYRLKLEQAYGNGAALESTVLVALINETVEREVARSAAAAATAEEIASLAKHAENNSKAPGTARASQENLRRGSHELRPVVHRAQNHQSQVAQPLQQCAGICIKRSAG